MAAFLFLLFLLSTTAPGSEAWCHHHHRSTTTTSSSSRILQSPLPSAAITTTRRISSSSSSSLYRYQRPSTTTTTSSLSMSYQFPPPKQDKTKDLIQLAVSVVVGSLFFASPIGGFVLGIFNSFLLLVLGLPILAIAGFTAWQSVYTLSGECPNCGAPATVLKRKRGSTNDVASQQQQEQPSSSICFNCASVLQANADNTGIENVTGRTTLQDLESSSSVGGGGSTFFDGLFGGTTTTSSSKDSEDDGVFVTQSKTSNSSNKPKKQSNEDIIDVEVESKNDTTNNTPWQ